MNRKWRYHITVHASDDILAMTRGPVEQAPPTIFCDDEGACYFDSGPNPLTQAIEQLLNQVGEDGWELVQIAFRPGQIIGFWKQEVIT
jgi:hypothetical protein